VEARARALVERMQAEATSVAALEAARRALAGDRGALVRLFAELDARARDGDPSPSLAVDAIPLRPVAWAGRTADPAKLEGLVHDRSDVFVLGGTVTTTLVASAPVHDARRRVVGRGHRSRSRSRYAATSATSTSTTTTSSPAPRAEVEFRYVDARGESEGPRPFDHPAPGVFFRDGILRAPDGGVLAAVRAIVPAAGRGAAQPGGALPSRPVPRGRGPARRLWALGERRERGWHAWRWAVAAVACRLLFVYVPPAFPLLSSEIVSPDTYASALLGPLLISPDRSPPHRVTLLALAAVSFDGARRIPRARPP
jgi:hypothetical protein